jgi:hypothetical protein
VVGVGRCRGELMIMGWCAKGGMVIDD